jgi:hypothetical protein
MAVATLSRGGTSIDIPLLGSGQELVLGVDLGKPNLNIQESGELQPRFNDQWSGQETYTLLGQFTNSDAYSKAITLADLIKSNSNGESAILNIDLPEIDTDIKVAPAAGNESALSINYIPGRKNWIQLDLGLTRIKSTRAGGEQEATTPTASGSGPITLSDGSTTVEMSTDIEVVRNVGRPNSVIRRSPDAYPYYEDKRKAAYDSFELNFEFVENTTQQVLDIRSLINQRLGRTPLTLDFNGLYGMGAMDVIPEGSRSLRHTRQSGQEGTSLVPTLNLRRIQ